MSPTAKNSSAKFATGESTLTGVLKSTDNIVKNVNLASTSQRSPPIFTPIPFHTYHGVTGGVPLGTTSVTRTTKTAVVSPKKPKATPRSAVITANGTSTVHPVVVKLKTAVKSLDGKYIKSG